jgi:hypothetical protein
MDLAEALCLNALLMLKVEKSPPYNSNNTTIMQNQDKFVIFSPSLFNTYLDDLRE